MSTALDVCDVVVVGAGLTGALVARRLADENLKVAVLEAREQIGGLAKYGVGVAFLGTPEPYVDLVARVGEDSAKQIWALTAENLELLKRYLQLISHPLNHVGSIRATVDANEATSYESSTKLLSNAGFSVALEDATAYGYQVSINTQGDLGFDPVSLIQALLDHENITTQTNIQVQAIKARENGSESSLAIWAHRHYVQTKAVVLCNGAYAGHLASSVNRTLHPLLVQSVDLKCADSLPSPLIVEDGHVAITAKDTYWRMAGWTPDAGDAWSLLATLAERLCPNASVLQRHSDWVARSQDDLPIVGELPDMPNGYIIGGLGPWGASWAFIAVEELLGLMIHGKQPGLLNFARFSQPH